MATSILSLFGNEVDPFAQQQQAFQQRLSQATDPRAFIATVGSNLGGQLGGLASNLISGPSREQKIQKIYQAVGNISDPLGQAQEAYRLFQQEGMPKEAQMVLQSIRELQKEADAEKAKVTEMRNDNTFTQYMSEAAFEKPEDFLKAAKVAFATKKADVGSKLLNSYTTAQKEAKAGVKPPEDRTYHKGDQTIFEQWNPETQKYDEVARAPRSITTPKDKPASVQELEWHASQIGCDLKDPACYNKAQERVLTLKRATPGEGQILSATVKKLNEDREKALTTRTRIKGIDRAIDILDGKMGGTPIVGAAANVRLGIDKFAALFKISTGDAAAVTEALSQNRIEDAARLLATGAFGSGTAVSDRDLMSAFSAVGADLSMTAKGLRMIFKRLRDDGVDNLNQYLQDIETYDSEVFSASKKSKKYYILDIPQIAPNTNVVTTPVPINEMSTDEIRRRIQERTNDAARAAARN